ncbi:2',3'-cyclic-nucleotide 2'-phosphodiesterase (5'-nucleotidase family) [Geomicrobium halophilum]|uniref:2',3'-cyclic-nucleotide 2'-phosphodiesterase (5'-nucleotidase family) n=1 Tax=Geomicrobium halophilum TaxID=549000 RepID=A0A841Q232_9BACL|nr:bifunctional UDP-sugar hydrolase/5'-nucleotidase [Geomicrobium halophilum]MBB6450218.1 2',3'-cyclic-nucleotide 2'-phosphodiesterase (5'-nucleotidase family) [Geomicrobium halophilum]
MAEEQLYIYHTNDLHSQLRQWPKIVHYMEKQEQRHHSRGEHALFFDLGDHADRIHPITEATQGRGNIDLLNASPVQYATIGNNEGITFPKKSLDHLYTPANFHVLLSNLYTQEGNRPEWAQPTLITSLSSQGPDIGMIGLTAPFYPFYHELGWVIRDPFEVLDAELPRLQQSADIVIILSHLGLFLDEQIAASYDVDLILGSHTHHRLDPAPFVDGTMITQTGKLGTHIGAVTITYDSESKRMIKGSGTLVSMEGNLPHSEHTEKKMQSLQRKADDALDEVIATRDEPLAISWTEPSSFSTFLVQQLRAWCQVDIAMVHAGLLLASLRPGTITKGQLHRICPHPVNPCVVKLKGYQLIEAIHHSFTEKMIHLPLKGHGFRGYKLGRMVFDGLDVEVEKTPEGTYSVNKITFQGEDIDENQDYNVATADMLTFGSLYPEVASSKEKHYYMPEFIRDVLGWGLKKEEPTVK